MVMISSFVSRRLWTQSSSLYEASARTWYWLFVLCGCRWVKMSVYLKSPVAPTQWSSTNNLHVLWLNSNATITTTSTTATTTTATTTFTTTSTTATTSYFYHYQFCYHSYSFICQRTIGILWYLRIVYALSLPFASLAGVYVLQQPSNQREKLHSAVNRIDSQKRNCTWRNARSKDFYRSRWQQQDLLANGPRDDKGNFNSYLRARPQDYRPS